MQSMDVDASSKEVFGGTGRIFEDIGNVAERLFDEVSNFFFTPLVDESEDPLVEVVRRDPVAASRFLRAVMLFSSFSGAFVAAFTGAFLSAYWSCCAGCDRPLRWWLLAHTVLQMAQVPVRLVFWNRLVDSDGSGQTEAVVSVFTSTPAWKVSKQVSLATYGWFVLGVVWALNAGACHSCPSVYRITVAVIIQAMIRAAAALFWFRYLFNHSEALMEPLQVEGATSEELAALPTLCFMRDLFPDDENPSCAVCLSEYMPGECLRFLPCKHHFHRHCADRWLCKSKRCPLCVRAIDTVLRLKTD